jgi:hypothetical protein
MVRFVLLSFALLILVMVAVALLVSALLLLTMAAVVAVPLYFVAKPHFHKRRVAVNPVERLQNLYVDGKIDLFEFERRVAQIVHVEH